MSRSGPRAAGDAGLRLRLRVQLCALRLQEQLRAEQFRRDPAGLVRRNQIASGHPPALPRAMQALLVVDHAVVVGGIGFALAVEARGLGSGSCLGHFILYIIGIMRSMQ